MIDAGRIAASMRDEGLEPWAEKIEDQLIEVLQRDPHGDWVRWRPAIDALPDLGPGRVDVQDGAVRLLPTQTPDASIRSTLVERLMQLHPWRKGPFCIAGELIDTEWRSDWKWDRLSPHIDALEDRLVLDVGCGNGYHCWRMAMAGARRVIGIDPTALFLAQFLAIKRLAQPMAGGMTDRVDLLPLRIEVVPADLARFDTAFSMGVLYHRRSPIDHLMQLRGALRKGGQLVLETLVIEGDDGQVLVPGGRYAKMRNVWFIPTTGLLETWLKRSGFRDARTVDVTVTRLEEQRSTQWMGFESLADFLDPADRRLTVEGYPAPRRAVLTATAE